MRKQLEYEEFVYKKNGLGVGTSLSKQIPHSPAFPVQTLYQIINICWKAAKSFS